MTMSFKILTSGLSPRRLWVVLIVGAPKPKAKSSPLFNMLVCLRNLLSDDI